MPDNKIETAEPPADPKDPWVNLALAVRESHKVRIKLVAAGLGLTPSAWARMELVKALKDHEREAA